MLSTVATPPVHYAGRHSTAVIAYVFPQDRLLRTGEIAAGKLTRINYAFANLKKGQVVEGFPHDKENLRLLTSLKKQHPSLEVLISVGGWSWSGGFSDAAFTVESRRNFIASALEFVKTNGLDGVDIDWEYPGQPGAGNKHRKEDKGNYTALLRELHERLQEESAGRKKPLLLTIAAGASEEFLQNTEMGQVQRYVNTVNLMSYDYYTPSGDRTTGNHAPLYANPGDPKQVSVDASVKLFEGAGVPAGKIVLGVPFYGHAWTHVSAVQHGLFQAGRKSDLEPDSKKIHELKNDPAFVGYWDRHAEAASLYNAETRTFISYESPEAVRAKCNYARKNRLGGLMFWEYSQDAGGELLDTIQRCLSSENE